MLVAKNITISMTLRVVVDDKLEKEQVVESLLPQFVESLNLENYAIMDVELDRINPLIVDMNGSTLSKGDLVLVPEPNTVDDLHIHEFVGSIKGFRQIAFTNEFNVVVEDGEGNCFEIESNRLSKED